MTDINDFLRNQDEFTQMRQQIGFEIDGIKSSFQRKIGLVNEQSQRHMMIHGDHLRLLKTDVAMLWRLLEQIEDCQNRLNGINECERVQKRGS